MAGQEIYLGKMIEALNSSIDIMTAKMIENVSLLTALSQSSSQQLSALSVAPGEEKTSQLTANNIVSANWTSAPSQVWSCAANGNIHLSGSFTANWNPSGYTTTIALQVSVDNGATWQTIATTGTLTGGNTSETKTFTNFLLSVTSASKIKFRYLNSNGNASGSASLNNDCYFKYKLNNIITDGAFTKY